jgi:hypothetical protein
VNRPYERVRDALRQNALTVFQSATKAAASRAQSIAAELHVDSWILAHGGTTPQIMEAINYVFDTLLYAGTALVLASALPRDPDRVEKT